MNFNDYVLPELLVLIPVLYVLGTQGVSAEAVFTSIVQGVLVTAAAVYANQLIKQSSK